MCLGCVIMKLHGYTVIYVLSVTIKYKYCNGALHYASIPTFWKYVNK